MRQGKEEDEEQNSMHATEEGKGGSGRERGPAMVEGKLCA